LPLIFAYKLVRFAPNWNDGILEHWNIGFWASGSESLRPREKMENWVIVKFLFTGIKKRNIIFLKSAFHYSMSELKI
jgi:hypothetical protein